MRPSVRQQLVPRLLQAAHIVTSRLADPGVRRLALIVSALVFVVGLLFSVRARPDLLTDLRWGYLLLALLAVPVSTTIGGVGFLLTAWLVRSPIGYRQAMEVTVLGGAANLLPLPGSAMLRIAALRSAGTRLRVGTGVTLVSAAMMTAVAALVAGSVLVGREGAGWSDRLLAAVGAVGVLASTGVCVRISGRVFLSLLMLVHKGLRIGFSALQIWLSFAAMGEAVNSSQCLMLSVANIVASAVAVAPAGLGVREVVAAALAPLVALSPASAFLAASLTRLVVLAGVLPMSLWYARSPVREAGRQ
jgi:hypothetical protein